MKVIICDDQAVVRDGLKLLLELEQDIDVIGLAQDGSEAVELAAKSSPDLVLMDLKMPGMNGVEATRHICAEHSSVKILVLTTFDDDEWVFDALGAGASGYLLKDTPREKVIEAIRGTVLGKTYVDPMVTGKLLDQVAATMENSRLYNETQKRLKEQYILNEVICSISSRLEWDEFMELVYRQVNRFINAETFLIASYDSKTDEWQAVFSKNTAEAVPSAPIMNGRDEMGYVISVRKPLLVNNHKDAQEFKKATGREITGAASKSWMGVPMIVGDRVVGAMVAQSYEFENFYTLEDLNLFALIGSQVAIAFENVQLFAQVQRLAASDTLTGVHNRRHFFELGEIEVERAARYGRDLVAVMLDLDNFKNVNDNHGHLAGDQVLQAVARTCCQALRKIDIVGRYGGEEFAIIMPETSLESAVAAAERLCEMISELELTSPTGTIKITASLGLASMGQSRTSLETLLDQADKALYTAKLNGKNRAVVYGPSCKSTMIGAHSLGYEDFKEVPDERCYLR